MKLEMEIFLQSSNEEPLPIDIFRLLENKIGNVADKILRGRNSGREIFKNKSGPDMEISWRLKPSD